MRLFFLRQFRPGILLMPGLFFLIPKPRLIEGGFFSQLRPPDSGLTIAAGDTGEWCGSLQLPQAIAAETR